MLRMGCAFLPVADPRASARWFADTFDLVVTEVDEWSAQLSLPGDDATSVTLLGPASGIPAEPGLPFATFSLVATELDGLRDRLVAAGHEVEPVAGDADVCRFFTLNDLDGNTLLVVDR